MPETPVDKYRQSLFRKNKIWLAEERILSTPASDPVLSKDSNEPHFGGGIATPLNA